MKIYLIEALYLKISFLNKINNFEQKYCSFDEIRQGTSIDRDVFTYALIAELKRKTQIE